MSIANKNKPLTVKLKDDQLQINIGVDILMWALEHAPCCPFKIVDKDIFIKELISSLNSEEEDGSTLIHRAFDEAANNAFEDGACGVQCIYEYSASLENKHE